MQQVIEKVEEKNIENKKLTKEKKPKALSSAKREEKFVFWLFLFPVLFAFFMVVVIPFFLGIYYSFTNWSSTSAQVDFVGLANYKEVFKDVRFLYSILLTSVYTILNMIAINVVSFSLALLVTSKIKLKNFYRAGFFVPNLIGGLTLGYIWQFIFNNFIPSIGKVLPSLSFLAEPSNYMLAKASTALFSLVIVGTWQYAGYIMMIYVAALQNVPADLNEAAEIDGANAWQRLKSITLPMVAPAFTITMFLTLVNSFKQFDVNVSLTGNGPTIMFMDTPIFGSQLMALDIYNTAFSINKMALAQAKAVIFFLALVIISILQVYFNKKKEVEM